ncbi:nuclear transport factor 2 family protein [soil metagenome]
MTITQEAGAITAAAHAQNWATTLTADVDSALALYADAFSFDDRADVDHVIDTAITKAELRPRLAPYANKDRANGSGVHRFEVREVFDVTGDNGRPAVVILWTWTGENLESYSGLPVNGATLTTLGITWHQLDDAGKITRETTYWNDTPLLAELGVPVQTPHYWEADFVF